MLFWSVAAGKEEAILPDDEEKDAENAVNRTENTHADLQDERVTDTADYSAFKKNIGG